MQSSDTSIQLINTQSPERSIAGFDADDISKLTDFFSILISIDQRSKKGSSEKTRKKQTNKINKGIRKTRRP